MKKKQICILGSTGSIGTQALEVIAEHPDRYEAYCLTANTQVEKLALQARRFRPAAVVIADESRYDTLSNLLSDCPDIKVYAGKEALEDIVCAEPVDMVLTAMVGFAGLRPTVRAIKAHKKICLANKETLVVAGETIMHHPPAAASTIYPEKFSRFFPYSRDSSTNKGLFAETVLFRLRLLAHSLPEAFFPRL